jgi:ABC-type hemin transport system ATPase subunit
MKSILSLFVLVGLSFSAAGQANKQQPPKAKVDTSQKRVVLRAVLGPYGNGSTVFVTDLKVLIGGELKVVDSISGTAWKVVRYRLGWRRKEMTDDYRTGKKKIMFNFTATDVFDTGKIPVAWQNEMKANMQATEEISFESIYVQHPVTKKTMECPPVVLKLR